MGVSGAAIVKNYLERYVSTNLMKTKKNKHSDQPLARFSLSIAYNIIHEMDYLIFSNNANDFDFIKTCLKQNVALLRQELKKRQSVFSGWFTKTLLPEDFGKCVYDAWYSLHELEKQQLGPRSRASS